MRNAGMDEAQTAIRFTGRNVNNLRYADKTIIMAQNEEEQKSLLMKVKEESENSAFRKVRSWYLVPLVQFSSVQFSCSVVSDTL